MKTVSLPSAKMLDTSKAFARTYLKTEGKEHRHGDGTVHSHAGTAFTTWIDFSQASQQAEAIAARFKKSQPRVCGKDRRESRGPEVRSRCARRIDEGLR